MFVAEERKRYEPDGLTLEEASILFFKEIARLKHFSFELNDDLLDCVRAHPISGGNQG